MFTAWAWERANYEFVLYALVIIILFTALLLKQRALQFDGVTLWGLSIWGLLHMAGGNVDVGDGVLYAVQLFPRVLRFDQLVHFFGFGVATMACHHLLRSYLKPQSEGRFGLAGLVVLMGCGIGALNEVVEFVAVLIVPETGVGGYENTLWDMVYNLLGATAATAVLVVRGTIGRPRDSEA